jgi:hypothetical protein
MGLPSVKIGATRILRHGIAIARYVQPQTFGGHRLAQVGPGGHDPLHRQAAQVGERTGAGRGAQHLAEQGADMGGLVGRQQLAVADHRRAAFDDGLLHQPARERRSDQDGGILRAGRLAEYRDIGRIAAEPGDIVVHPAQGGDLIEDAVGARGIAPGFSPRLGVADKAENAQPVVERDHDHAAA